MNTVFHAAVLALLALAHAAYAADTTAAAQLAYWQGQAGVPASVERGKAFYAARPQGDLSCASCHGPVPIASGRHASTGKVIEPLAPAFNAGRFADTAKINKWFKRNCNDVASRECTPVEKADVLAYLLSLKP